MSQDYLEGLLVPDFVPVDYTGVDGVTAKVIVDNDDNRTIEAQVKKVPNALTFTTDTGTITFDGSAARSIDLTNISRKNANETITGSWTFNNGLTIANSTLKASGNSYIGSTDAPFKSAFFTSTVWTSEISSYQPTLDVNAQAHITMHITANPAGNITLTSGTNGGSTTIDGTVIPKNKSLSTASNLENGSGSSSLQQLPQDFVLDDETPITAGATNEYAVSLTGKSLASGKRSLAHGTRVRATGDYSHAEGNLTLSSGANSHAEGLNTVASASNAHAEGYKSNATAFAAHAEGTETTASGENSISAGTSTTASGVNAISLGNSTATSGNNSIAGGSGTVVAGHNSIGVGENLDIKNIVDSGALGLYNTIRTSYSFTTGAYNTVSHSYASALGLGLTTSNDKQTVVGSFNALSPDTLFTVGNGTNENSRSNAFEVYANGSAKVGLMGNDNLSITTKQYVDTTDNALAQRITNLEGRGRFLSTWNASTGKPGDLPSDIATKAYQYKTGDYYIVNTAGNKNPSVPASNTIPAGTTLDNWTYFVIGTQVEINDTIYFTGSVWTVLHTPIGQVAWGTITGTLSNQTDLQTALNGKQATLSGGNAIDITSNTISVKYDNDTIKLDENGKLYADVDTEIEWGDIGGTLADQTDLSTALSGKESTSNKVVAISGSSTDTQYASAKCVWDNLQNVREVAEGKCKSWVLSYDKTAPTEETFQYAVYYDIDGNLLQTWADFVAYLSAKGITPTDCINNRFNSNNDEIDFATENGGSYILCTYDNIETSYNVVVRLVRNYEHPIDIKVGDIFYVMQTNVADRWFDGRRFAYKLETSKVDLSGYATTGTTQTISGAKTFSNEVSFIDGTGTSQIVNSIGTDSYGGFNIYRSGASVFGVDGGDIRVRNRHLLPENNNTTYSLGSQTAQWKDLYLSGSTYYKASDTKSIYAQGYQFFIDGNGGLINFSGKPVPIVDTTYDLGQSDRRWKDIYLGGKVTLTDGTGTANSTWTVFNGQYNNFVISKNGSEAVVINASDMAFRDRDLLPNAGNTTYSLGSSVARWKDLYINGNLNLLSPNPNYSATIKATNGGYINIGNLQISGVLYSTSNKDLGLSGYKWKDGYFSGTVYADKVEQTSPNWDAGEITLIMAPTETTLTQRYCKVEAINGVLYIVINFELENVSGSAYTIYSGPRCIINNVPSSIGSKIYDFNGKNLTEENVGSSFLMIATNSAYHRIGTEAIYSAIPQQLSTLGVCRGGSGSLNQLIIFPLFTSTTIPAGEKLFFSGRISLTLI